MAGCASSPPSMDPAVCTKPLTYDMSIPSSCRTCPATSACPSVSSSCLSSCFALTSLTRSSAGGSFSLTALMMAISAWNAGTGTTPRWICWQWRGEEEEDVDGGG